MCEENKQRIPRSQKAGKMVTSDTTSENDSLGI